MGQWCWCDSLCAVVLTVPVLHVLRYALQCSRSPIVLSVVLPLLKALVSARGAGGNPTLADRLAGLVTKHLARARPVFEADADAAGAAVTALEADARKVLYYASRDKDPRVAGAAAQSLLVLITAGSEAGGAAAGVAQANAAAALQDFLQHKKSRLQQAWCQQLLSRCFDAVVGGEAAGLQALLTACSKGRNEAIRAKSVQLLPSLITGKQPQQVAVMLAALKQHQGLLASALGAGVVGPYKNKDQHATTVKAVVTLLAGVVKQGGGKRLAEVVGSETVRELGKSVVVVKVSNMHAFRRSQCPGVGRRCNHPSLHGPSQHVWQGSWLHLNLHCIGSRAQVVAKCVHRSTPTRAAPVACGG